MIVPEKKEHWFHLIFRIRGTIILQIRYRLLAVILISIIVTVIQQNYFFGHTLFSTTPFSLIGLALGIFLGFRNNTSYDRFWEARKLWGGVVNYARSITRQIETLIAPEDTDEERKALVYQTIAYVHCLRMHLRNEWKPQYLNNLLSEKQISYLTEQLNRPIGLLHLMGKGLQELYQREAIHPQHLPTLEHSLEQLTNLQGGCERIKSTPIPFSYNILLHRIVAIYCFTLPFGLVSITGWLTPLVTTLVAYAFLGIDAIGDEIEEPFGYDSNDLPLSAITTMIEVNLRQAIGETEVPELRVPDPLSQILD